LVIVLIGFVLLVLLVLGYFLVLVSAMAGSSQNHDSDEALIKRFHERREALEQLRGELSEEPDLEYRLMIARDGSMKFTTSSGGNVQHSSEKGYAYLVTAPDSLCRDLDEASKMMRPFPYSGWTGYRHIEGNWYLYFTGD
jgi:hypothetical protein